jgi:hypothetical protein
MTYRIRLRNNEVMNPSGDLFFVLVINLRYTGTNINILGSMRNMMRTADMKRVGIFL